MTDFIFMVRGFLSYMFVTGPDVVKTVTNEVVTAEELGGASTHTQEILGVSRGRRLMRYDIEMLAEARRLIDFLPLNNRQISAGPPVL